MTNAKLMQELKEEFNKEYGISLDFRTHVYLDNQYGLCPIYDYDLAEKIIKFTYNFLTDYLNQNKILFSNFGGWQWNLNMEIEKLRTITVKYFIESTIEALLAYKLKNIMYEINDKNYSIPSFIQDIEVKETESIDGGYYLTEFIITTIDNDIHDCIVNVQVCGTTYQSQNGCYLDGYYVTDGSKPTYDGNDFINEFECDICNPYEYNEQMCDFIDTLQSIAISKAENSAEYDINNNMDEESETGSKETWKYYSFIKSEPHSATSTINTCIEVSSDDRYRIIKKIEGFVQPNDYAVEPESVLIAFFDNKSELDEYLD